MKLSNFFRTILLAIKNSTTSRWDIAELPDENGEYYLERTKRHSPLTRMILAVLLAGAGVVAVITVALTLVRHEAASPSGSIFIALFGLAFILYGVYLFYVGLNQNWWRKIYAPQLKLWMKAKYRKPAPVREPIQRKRFTLPNEEKVSEVEKL